MGEKGGLTRFLPNWETGGFGRSATVARALPRLKRRETLCSRQLRFQLRQLFFYVGGFAVVGIDLQHAFQMLAGEVVVAGFLVGQSQVIVDSSVVGRFAFLAQLESFLEEIDG